MYDCDICIVGSGAGASPIAYELVNSGYHVTMLEKGLFFKEEDFSKDEISNCRRSVYTPDLNKQYHEIEKFNKNNWVSYLTKDSNQDFWNGNCVGGSSNFMSGYFHRMKPIDFRLYSEFGKIPNANTTDWAITYEDLSSYYDKVESIIGVSGRIVNHNFLEPRVNSKFPYEPTKENYVSELIDNNCKVLGYQSIPVARAIITQPKDTRSPCYYSNYCGSYGCNSGAKSSARASLINQLLEKKNFTLITSAHVYKLNQDKKNKIKSISYYDKHKNEKTITAKIFVIACQAIESVRLLQLSTNQFYPNGIGDKYNQLGKNLIFSSGGNGSGILNFKDYSEQEIRKLKIPGLFVNRSIQEDYIINDPKLGKIKGGLIDFLFEHSNPIKKANSLKWLNEKLIWGIDLKERLKKSFTQEKVLNFEIFNDWLPNDNCYVSLSDKKDYLGNNVAKIRINQHEHDRFVANILSKKAINLFKKMNLKDIKFTVSKDATTNLQAGGCRFGNDPETSYLDYSCKNHFIDNLYVTDSSFMPTGGSVPYTFTIYANSFRVADIIKERI